MKRTSGEGIRHLLWLVTVYTHAVKDPCISSPAAVCSCRTEALGGARGGAGAELGPGCGVGATDWGAGREAEMQALSSAGGLGAS